MAGPHLEVVAEQVPEQAQVLTGDGGVQTMAAEVDPLARHLEAPGHAPDPVLGLDHQHLMARPGGTERGGQAGGAGADDHELRRTGPPRRRAMMVGWRQRHSLLRYPNHG